MKPYYQYAEDVLDGNIVVGEYIRLACKRFKDDLSNPAWDFREDKVDRALHFMSSLKHFKGKSSGENFILEPWQQWIVANIIGFYHKGTNERRFTSSYIEISRKNGKQLSLDTPIITPNGYTTMGDIKVGDKVFDENGNECNVTYVTPIDYKPTSYEITFSDGEVIKACKDHNWYVSRNQKDYHVETTQDIIDKGYFRNRKDGYKSCYVSVPLAKPLQMHEKPLPIDPYTFGVWLGDGSKAGAVLYLNGDDRDEITSYIPYEVKWTKQVKDENCYYVSYSNTEFAKALSDNDLRNNKHIPNTYLFNSYENRLALLQGLMDADGAAMQYPNGGVQFEIKQKNKNIADGICFLLSSFGIKYNCREKKAKLYDKDCGIVYRITFNADKRIPPFRLRRKYNLLKDRKGKRDVKYIKNIRPIQSIPMRCITVDSPNHLYLCGIKNTVTHNTALAAALCVYFLIADGEDGAEVDLAANSREQAKIAFEFCYNFSKQLDPKEKYLKSKLKGIEFKPNHSKLNVFAADASKLDGFNASFALIDEYHSAKNSKVRDVIKSSMGMRRSPHLCTITTAGFDKTAPCYHLRTTCIEILQKIKEDDSIFIAVYSIDDDDDWTDENVWAKSSPNLDVTVTSKYIKEQIKSALNNPSEEVGVKTKTLNIWCNSSNTWINDNYINKVTGNVDIDNFKSEICYVGVDLSATSDLTAVSYLVPKDDVYYFKVKYYLPESCLHDSQNKELYKQWMRTGELTITPGNVTDYDYITNDLMKARGIVKLYKIAYDKWNATQWAIDAVEKGLPLEEYSQSIGNFNQPTKEFERLILSGNIVIDNNEITRWCFRNVHIKEDYCGNAKPTKGEDYSKKIDGVIAMIQSLGIYLKNPKHSKKLIV